MHPILGRSLAELFAKADCVQAKYGTTAAVAPTAVVCLRNWRLDELFMIEGFVLEWNRWKGDSWANGRAKLGRSVVIPQAASCNIIEASSVPIVTEVYARKTAKSTGTRASRPFVIKLLGLQRFINT